VHKNTLELCFEAQATALIKAIRENRTEVNPDPYEYRHPKYKTVSIAIPIVGALFVLSCANTASIDIDFRYHNFRLGKC
jgi:hypothetical protein